MNNINQLKEFKDAINNIIERERERERERESKNLLSFLPNQQKEYE